MCFSLVFTLFSSGVFAAKIFERFPEKINANEKYVFYSHGFIVEGTNPTPINPRWGMYDFPQIKFALSDKEYNLIAYHRPKNTNPKMFASQLAGDASQLIKKGVKPENITFVGFSRGGTITALTSSVLANSKVNFVILAGCGDYLKNNLQVTLHGHIYSMFETSDNLVSSCKFLIERSKSVQSFVEQSISTGKEHGAFYTPLPEWVVPVKVWIKSSYR
jgi:pimeloyl-ACP methyl ester carboxylesterase